MREFLYGFFGIALSFSSAAQAFDLSRPGVFQEINAELVESSDGDNELLTVKLSGFVKNGSGACDASFNRAGIRAVEDQGSLVIKATLTPVGNLALMCDGSFDESWKGSAVSKTIQIRPEQLETATVANVRKKGESVSLKGLIGPEDQAKD